MGAEAIRWSLTLAGTNFAVFEGGLGGGHHVAAGDKESRSVCLEADDRVSTRICGMRM